MVTSPASNIEAMSAGRSPSSLLGGPATGAWAASSDSPARSGRALVVGSTEGAGRCVARAGGLALRAGPPIPEIRGGAMPTGLVCAVVVTTGTSGGSGAARGGTRVDATGGISVRTGRLVTVPPSVGLDFVGGSGEWLDFDGVPRSLVGGLPRSLVGGGTGSLADGDDGGGDELAVVPGAVPVRLLPIIAVDDETPSVVAADEDGESDDAEDDDVSGPLGSERATAAPLR